MDATLQKLLAMVGKQLSKEKEAALDQPGASWEMTPDGLKIFTAEEAAQREKEEQEERINSGMRNLKAALQLRSERDALLTTIILKERQAGAGQGTQRGSKRGKNLPTMAALDTLRNLRGEAIRNNNLIPTRAAAMNQASITDKTWKKNDKELWTKWFDKNYEPEKQE